MLRTALRPSSPTALLRARRLCDGAAPRPTLLAALVERPPRVTPEPSAAEAEQRAFAEGLETLHKVYPTSLTSAEEGPDQQRARLRMESILEREATREGEGDRTGDETSLDRRLAQRLYLLVRRGDGPWQFPQREWAGPPERARDGLEAAIGAACGEALSVHQLGNAPLGHLERPSGGTLFLWRFLYVAGEVDAADGLQHAWLTKEELTQRVDAELCEFSAHVCGPHP